MTTYTIETSEQGVTLSVDGGEPQPLESVEQACDAIEQAEGVEEPGEEEMQAQEQQGMEAGFAKARGGMLGG